MSDLQYSVNKPFWDYDDGDSTITIIVKNETKTYVYYGVFLM